MNYTSNFTVAHAEHKKLLSNLKTTIETIFLNNISGESWLQSGGLLQLHASIEQIFYNGIRIFKPDNTADCWRFIEGLNWINPSMTISIANQIYSSPSISSPIPCARIKSDKALSWIYENLEKNKLSEKLKYLVSDSEHLSSCYEITAYLQHKKYLGALFLCLTAIENNQPNLLSQIDESLYSNKAIENIKTHKRSTSHPDFSIISTTKVSGKYKSDCRQGTTVKRKSYLVNSPDVTDIKSAATSISLSKLNGSSLRTINRKVNRKLNAPNKQFCSLKLRPWGSLPDIHEDFTPQRIRSKTISQPIHIPHQSVHANNNSRSVSNQQKVPSFSYTQNMANDSPCSPMGQEMISRCDVSDLNPISLMKCDDIKIHFDSKYRPTTASHKTVEMPSFQEKTASTSPPKNQQSPIYGLLSSCLSTNSNVFSLLNGSGNFTEKEKCANCEPSTSSFGSTPSDFVSTFIPRDGKKIQNRYGSSMLNDINGDLTCFIHSPVKDIQRPWFGQSLTSFLQASQLTRSSNNDLERENAHFSVSEAMISAIEQIKWRKIEKIKNRKSMGHDERMEIKRKRQQCKRLEEWDCDAKYCSGISSNEEQSDDGNISNSDLSNGSQDGGDLNYLKCLSVSTHSLNDHTATAEWGDSIMDTLSAESVALSLISKFSDKQLPKASDFLWLVSEQDAPQRILPMPGSWTVSPDEFYKIPFTRGTRDWAPPRAQIIFTRHPPPERKVLLHKQNQRCAGCGMKVAAAYSNRFRYCEYLGKYHCTGCHRNQISIIPSRVLDKWDFACYPVSVFSYRLLDQIWTLPLFRVSDLNKLLYTKIRSLRYCRFRRLQLKYVQDFIVSCRFADDTKKIFDTIGKHLTTDTDIWSMTDFIAVRNGSLTKSISQSIGKCEEHVFNCELCMARGFICELCPKKQTIFPWQSKVRRCNDCGACFHEGCWKDDCAKCQRLKKRQQQNVLFTSSGGARKI